MKCNCDEWTIGYPVHHPDCALERMMQRWERRRSSRQLPSEASAALECALESFLLTIPYNSTMLQ